VIQYALDVVRVASDPNDASRTVAYAVTSKEACKAAVESLPIHGFHDSILWV
jgi:hypothetical protein